MSVWSNEQVADYISKSFWGGTKMSFDVAPGGTITVNLTQLTSTGQNLAREALGVWSDVIGVKFGEVTTGGQITFDDNESGAFARSSSSGSSISSSHVNISTDWVANYGSSIGGYSFQTYIHEIGHALGLGHSGSYNGTADYANRLYDNDGWPTTVMSYFSQYESTHFRDQGFSYAFVTTPMIADVMAMGMTYGLSTTTRLGDTTYGFNSNAGRASYDANVSAKGAYTVFDNGGVDTLDYSGFSHNQSINLNSGVFSNVGGLVGNVTIAVGTIIENAIGGSGGDVLVGNGANNCLMGGGGADQLFGGDGLDVLIGGLGADLLTGGSGNDVFKGTCFDLSGDSILDLTAGDVILFTDALLSSFSYSISGSTLVYTGGSLLLSSAPSSLFAQAAAGGGVQVMIGSAPAPNQILGTMGNDTIHGTSSNDVIDGFAGADAMYGDLGDDIYIVDNVGDTANERVAAGGTDLVRSSVSFVLRNYVDNLTLTGNAAINATGSSRDNVLIGNDAANVLNGGAGADSMTGGLGNDSYYVDNAGDLVIEGSASGGLDVVRSSISFTLGSNVENLILTGSSATSGVGNDLANQLIGNAGNNQLVGGGGNDVLKGGAGTDIMSGGTGNDLFYVTDPYDFVTEKAGEGIDRIISTISFYLEDNVEVLTLSGTGNLNGNGNMLNNTITGTVGANILQGAGGRDVLKGDAGNDTLYGGDGIDSLYGGSGRDSFIFDTSPNKSSNFDRIYDFSVEDDTIILDDVVFSAAGPFGSLSADAFHIGTSAHDASDRIIYNQANGYLYYDSDGNGSGAAVLFATVSPGLAMSFADFFVI